MNIFFVLNFRLLILISLEIVSAVWPTFLVHGRPTHIDLDQFNISMSRLTIGSLWLGICPKELR